MIAALIAADSDDLALGIDTVCTYDSASSNRYLVRAITTLNVRTPPLLPCTTHGVTGGVVAVVDAIDVHVGAANGDGVVSAGIQLGVVPFPNRDVTEIVDGLGQELEVAVGAEDGIYCDTRLGGV